MQPTTEFRPHTPILEDPKEDRSPSVEPGEISKTSDTTAPSSIPAQESSSDVKSEETSKEAAESQPSTSAQPEEKQDQPEEDAEKEEPPAAQEQPIFRPITTDKGKSKVYGKTIGGWI